MSSEALIDYGLIILFFVGLGGLLFVVSNSPNTPTAVEQVEERNAVQPATPQERKVAYAFLVLLFVFFILTAFFSRRNHAGTGLS